MDEPSPVQKLRERMALAVGENAVFDGWTKAAIESTAARLDVNPAQARLAFPKNRTGMIDAYIEAVDRTMEERLLPKKLQGVKIREKIRALIWTRLQIMAPAREAVRRAMAILAMPQNVPLAMRIGWRTADLMWRLAGDTSTDYNHYTKRMTLGAVYTSTLLVWLDDDSEGWSETSAFLDRRIENVMQFERWKAGWRAQERFSVSRFLGRLRYPPR